jgi:radical SAM-linked protein
MFARDWQARFLSHLDIMRLFGRALRRSGLPVYFTEGFNPKPKVSYESPPLPMGHTSACERFSFKTTSTVVAAESFVLLHRTMPDGMRFLSIVENAVDRLPIAMRYEVYLAGEPDIAGVKELKMVESVAKLDEDITLPADIPRIYSHRIVISIPTGEGYAKPEKILLAAVEGIPAHYHRAELFNTSE